VDALAGQPAKQQHAGIAGARQVGQIQDEGSSGLPTGLAQDDYRVVAEPSCNPNGREVRRLIHAQAEGHLARSFLRGEGIQAQDPDTAAAVRPGSSYASGKKRSKAIPVEMGVTQCHT
jgi:hypothetical protein